MKYIFILLLVTSSIACGKKSTGISYHANDILPNQTYPSLYSKALDEGKLHMQKILATDINIPIPKDLGGGYTHEVHKQNYLNIQLAGDLYKVTKDIKYAVYVKNVFLEYASIFKKLPIHPTRQSFATGKLFWQCLNDANWLVYGAQAYDAIYTYLTTEEKIYIEEEFLKPYADFLSIENPQFFNRVHNHSTWGNAAVGMAGLAMRDTALVKRALYGLPFDKIDTKQKDNDGGYIYDQDKLRAGFYAQIDFAFSPDGYYEEGPYYQRYAMWPFMLFAKAIEDKMPELKIFAYRDSILTKAVTTLMLQTTDDYTFYPINDALKNMSIQALSVVTTLHIAYSITKDPKLLDIIRIQDQVLLDETGFEIAQDIEAKKYIPFIKRSMKLTDGHDGKKGGLAILRSGSDDRLTALLLKYSTQGLSHGHYDRLNYLLFDGRTEVAQDYGATRWVNVEQKSGGRYLKENFSWSKQTVAHNTIVQDRISQFEGKYEKAWRYHSDLVFFNISNPNLQVVCAKDTAAYPGTVLERTMLLWQNKDFEQPVVIDYITATSRQTHEYDLPFQFAGVLMTQDFNYLANNATVMGTNHGYQHLYQEASAQVNNSFQMNWMKDNKFYTLTSMAGSADSVFLARIGANDPNFNLRRETLLIHRKPKTDKARFLSVIENHGNYSEVTEVPINPYSKIKSVHLVQDTDTFLKLEIIAKDNKKYNFHIDKKNGSSIVN